MGYASTFENVYERLCESLAQLQHEVLTVQIPTGEHYDRICATFRQCENVLSEIHGYLDLATDPDVDFAEDLAQVKDANRRLHRRVGELETSMRGLDSKLSTRDTTISQLRREVRHWKDEAHRIDRLFETAIRQFPDVGYALYSSDARIRRFERD